MTIFEWALLLDVILLGVCVWLWREARAAGDVATMYRSVARDGIRALRSVGRTTEAAVLQLQVDAADEQLEDRR